MKNGNASSMKHLGSLCIRDLSKIASRIHEASLHSHVTVWSDPSADVFLDDADRGMDVPPARLAGTYGPGSLLGDIQGDLETLRGECLSPAILF